MKAGFHGKLVLFLYLIVICHIIPLQASAKELVRSALEHGFSAAETELDPRSPASRNIAVVLLDLFEPLLVLNSRNKIIGGGAEAFSLSDDGLHWTIKLKRDRYWSDGVPVTAGDYVYSLSTAYSMSEDGSTFSYTIVGKGDHQTGPVGIHALDDHTLQVDIKVPFSLPKQVFSFAFFSPLPRHVAPADGSIAWSKWPQKVSNGPYRLTAFEGNMVELALNPHYADHPPGAFESVRYVSQSWNEAAQDLLEGRLGVVVGIPNHQLDFFVDGGARHVFEDSQTYIFLTLNTLKEDLSDIRVRRALSLALNRSELVEWLTQNQADPATYLLPEAPPDITPIPYEDALNEAQALMRQAGYDENRRLKLRVSGQDADINERLVTILTEYWSRIHVDVETDFSITNAATWFQSIDQGEFEVGLMTRTPALQSPLGFLSYCLNLNADVGDPYCGYFYDPEFNDIILSLRSLQSNTTAIAHELKAARRLDDATPIIILLRYRNPIGLGSDICVAADNLRNVFPVSSNFTPRDAVKSVACLPE